MPNRIRRRECRDHERVWRDHCVDRNLKDAWLEVLNDLAAFDLKSVCEGHVSERTNNDRARPHINLRLKPLLLPEAVAAWDSVSAALADGMTGMFNAADTWATVELTLQVQLGPGNAVGPHKLWAKIRARRPRVSLEMDSETSDWFRRIVESIKVLDRLFTTQLRTGAGEGEQGAAAERPREHGASSHTLKPA